MPNRFQLGQHVSINDVIATRHTGQRAVIVEYRPNLKEIRTLDKYVVELSNGERVELWAIQLKSHKE